MVQLPDFVDRQELKALSQLKPWKTAFAIALDWVIILAAIVICEFTNSWLIWLVAIAMIVGRMHDFAHYRFIKNKQLSDRIRDIFLAWSIGTTVAAYRSNHQAHHHLEKKINGQICTKATCP